MMTKAEKFKIQVLLQMAKITDDSIKKSEYLNLIENLLSDASLNASSVIEENDFFIDNSPIGKNTNDYYNDYLMFCNDNGLIAGSKNHLGRQIKERFGVESKVKNINGKSIRIYTR